MVRSDNLYIIGFQGASNELELEPRYYYFKESPIPNGGDIDTENKPPLPFDENYDDIYPEGKRNADITKAKILGKLTTLQYPHNSTFDDKKTAIAYSAFLLCESLRFTEVYNDFKVRVFPDDPQQAEPITFNENLKHWVNEWSKLSRKYNDGNPQEKINVNRVLKTSLKSAS